MKDSSYALYVVFCPTQPYQYRRFLLKIPEWKRRRVGGDAVARLVCQQNLVVNVGVATGLVRGSTTVGVGTTLVGAEGDALHYSRG